MLSAKTIQAIKTITPAVTAHAEAITKVFYERMFRDNPEVKSLFNQAHQHAGTQQKALAGAIAAYFAHIEKPDTLMPAIEVIAQKHCSLLIKPQHYPVVGHHLLEAIKDVFGDAANDDVLSAVGEAYQFLANICIERERQIYHQQQTQSGGWSGFRDFTVTAKILESNCVYSFYLEPTDKGDLPSFKPGQYTTVRLSQLMNATSPRNYSLSTNPGRDYFRISVKRETADGAPSGIVSSFLHDHVKIGDTVQLAPPSGNFYLDRTIVGDAPLVFLAAGIGATPLLSMVKTLAASKSTNKATFLLANRNSHAGAFVTELRNIAKDFAGFRTTVFFDEPLADDLNKGYCDFVGRINREVLSDLPCSDAHFFVCGPKPFMKSVLGDLRTLGVSPDRTHFECFGPMESV